MVLILSGGERGGVFWPVKLTVALHKWTWWCAGLLQQSSEGLISQETENTAQGDQETGELSLKGFVVRQNV